MDRVTSLYKALDILTILGGRDSGCRASELAIIMHLPRSTVIRVLNSLVEYGFVTREGLQYCCTGAFGEWARPQRHRWLVQRYRPVLEELSRVSGELVLLGALDGNGVVHLDYIERDRQVPVAPAPETHHSIRHNAIGKLILSQRPDLAGPWTEADPDFALELETICESGMAWNHGETVADMVAVATHGFTRAQTDAKLVVAWPRKRFKLKQARTVMAFLRELLDNRNVDRSI